MKMRRPERQQLAAKLQDKHRRDKLKKEADDIEKELKRVDETWEAACVQGKESGCVRLCWVDLRHVDNRVYKFRSDYGRELKELYLDGIGLSSLEDITTHCKDLHSLSLASNSIQDISNIHCLAGLTQLNLLRNQLTMLPRTVGQMTKLTRLDVANNSLTELPVEISNLRGLKHLNLESNLLSELPISFGQLECEVLNLSCNKFTVCPSCLVDMKHLRQLSMNYNEIGCLPGGLHKLKKLEILHASKNRISILPDSIVDISTLQSLWLDSNQLSALPPNFHRLTRLVELKLEGNADLVYPPIQIVAMGTKEVLRWSRQRLELGKNTKIRHMVQSLGEVLSQVHHHKIGGPLHESVFEVADDQFQFPPDALWSIFLPELSKMWSDPEKSSNEGIKSFPYERSEVEQALFQFRDAAGPIVKKTAHANFRRCSCMITRHSSVVCVPPKTGWMCSRPALLVRKECYETNMIDQRRKLAEENSIAEAEEAAKRIATVFLKSNEGILLVREQAMTRMESSDKSRVNKVFKRLQVPSSIKRNSETKIKLKRIEEEIRESYIREKMANSRNEVIERNKRIGIVMQNWMGLSLFDAFDGWRYAVELIQQQRRRDERRALKEARLRFEDEVAKYEYEMIDLSQWKEGWDEFNDLPVWVHATTNETRYEQPVSPLHPPVPTSLIDSATGERLSQHQIAQNEADTESDNSSSFSSRESQESNKINDSTDDYAPSGMDSELELAKQRVLERQRHHVRRKYKM